MFFAQISCCSCKSPYQTFCQEEYCTTAHIDRHHAFAFLIYCAFVLYFFCNYIRDVITVLMILLSMLSDEGDRRKLFELYTQYQDAMLRVARRYFEIPCKKQGAYLVTIVKNESLTLLRKCRKDLPLDESLMKCSLDDDSATIIDTIRSMPETYRAVLEMRLVEERTTREIAAALGLSEGAVNTRISRGRALLAEKLRKEGYTA